MKIIGDIIILSIEVGGVYLPIGCLTNNSISENLETINSQRDQWTYARPTLQGYSISFNGLLTKDDLGGSIIDYPAIEALKRARTKINWKMSIEGASQQGSGYFTDLSDAAGMDQYISFNGSILGWGAIRSVNSTWITWDSSIITFDSGTVTWDEGFG
jgi:hypothetical protein